MRALVVAEAMPWPPSGGGLVRLARVVESVASATELDLVVFRSRPSPEGSLPPTIRVNRVREVDHPHAAHQLLWRLRWATRRGVPLEVVRVADDRGPERQLAEWARPPYDVVWFSTAAAFAWTGRPDWGPTIVDLMDLEDVKAALRAELLLHPSGVGAAAPGWRERLAGWQSRRNAADWSRFQHSIARQVERTVLSSEDDAARSGLDNAAVVPNTFPRPDTPAGRPAEPGPPVVLFQGSLTYPPNVDGAHWLVEAVAPAIRRRIPSVAIRLVGDPATSVRHLGRPGSVAVVGRVASMADELSRASVAVVPILYGSGTRVKILESFANRVPVVSTSIGAEGLDVEPGVHLLVADHPGEFADAVIRLLHDAELRVGLADAAERLYLERYDGRVADRRILRLIGEVGTDRTRS